MLELLFAFDFYNGFQAAKGLVAQLAPPGVLNSNPPTPSIELSTTKNWFSRLHC